MFRYFVTSDIHSNFGKPHVREFPVVDDVDGIIIAGDIGQANYNYIRESIGWFSDNYNHVVAIPGNHDYYDQKSFPETFDKFSRINDSYSNVDFFGYPGSVDSIKIGDTTVWGNTLWFPDHRASDKYLKYASQLNDFSCIWGFVPWVYEENARAIEIFSNIGEGDVVISHHAPSWRSVYIDYVGDWFCNFYVTDIEDIIVERKPKIWIHGHMHDSVKYEIGETKVFCNPFGYPNQRTGFSSVIVEI